MDGDFLGDSFLGEKLKELFFFAGAVATPPRATSQAWAAAWPGRAGDEDDADAEAGALAVAPSRTSRTCPLSTLEERRNEH